MKQKTRSLANKPPLITPSISPPPVTRSRSLVKKQKTATLSACHSRSETPDVNDEREASRCRLLDTWAGLARRYSRHMDEDDLVDIRTGEITKDNGFLRSARALEFGDLAAPSEDGSGAEYEDEGYDEDELDAFAGSDDDGSYLGECDANMTNPLLVAADAMDLQEFLEAERLRKEKWGVDADEGEFEETNEMEPRVLTTGRFGHDRQQGVEADAEPCLESDGNLIGPIQGGNFDDPVLDDDELDNWTTTESSACRFVSRKEDNDSDIEILSTQRSTALQKKSGTGKLSTVRSKSLSPQKSQPTPDRADSPTPLVFPSQDDAPARLSRHPTPQKRRALVSDLPLSLKRKRVPSDSNYLTPETDIGEEISQWQGRFNSGHKSTSYRQTSTKRQFPFATSPPTRSNSDSGSSPEKQRYKSHSLHSGLSPAPLPRHDTGSRMPPTHPSYESETFMPIPDPRAQLVIVQALHQLSALMGMQWQPTGYENSGSAPHTPSHRRLQHPGYLYATPNTSSQRRIDSSFSHATSPPASPEYDSVRERSGSRKRRALVHRSHSRGRRVSFRVEDDSPSKGRNPKLESKHLVQQEEWSSEDVSEYEQDELPIRPRYLRGQTPGPPSSHPSRQKALS